MAYMMDDFNPRFSGAEMTEKADFTTLAEGWGLGRWVALIQKKGRDLHIRFYDKVRIVGARSGNVLYETIGTPVETRYIRLQENLFYEVSNRNRGWRVFVTPSVVVDAARRAGVRVRLTSRQLPPLRQFKAAECEATELLKDPWYRVRSFEWVDPLNGFDPSEAVRSGYYRGWDSPVGQGNVCVTLIFKRGIPTPRILQALESLQTQR